MLTILTTAGFGHFTAISIEEKIVSIGVMLFGAFAFSLFITAMSGKGDEKEEQDSQLQRCYAEINSKINGKLIKKIDFFELLILNNEDQIKEFLMVNGKAPKAVCPVRFLGKEDL